MQKKHYVQINQWLRNHKTVHALLDFFATRIVFLYVCIPFVLVWFVTGREYITLAGVGLLVAWGIVVQLIGLVLPVRRPYQAYGFVPSAGKGLFSHVDEQYDSFPSGHTTALGVLTVAALWFSPALALVSLVITLCTAGARVFLGYHYVQDVVAALVLSSVVMLVLQYSGFVHMVLL